MTDLPDSVLAWLSDGARALVMTPFDPGNRLNVAYLLSALLLAGVSFQLYQARGTGFQIGSFLRFCFPREIYLHPSAIVDYKLFLVNGLFSSSFAASVAAATWWVEWATSRGLTSGLGPLRLDLPWNGWTLAATSLVMFLTLDFTDFITHWLQHRVPALWRFHRVHHSAETLTPITLFRVHPLLELPTQAVKGGVTGLLWGFIFYLFFDAASARPVLFPVVTGYILFNLLGGNLRHSHIWLSFGWVWNHVLISPAQHQIHHSVAPQHLYKNLGVTFAFWDWMFGTLYVPRRREELRFGLGPEEPPQVHPTLWKAYAEPFL